MPNPPQALGFVIVFVHCILCHAIDVVPVMFISNIEIHQRLVACRLSVLLYCPAESLCMGI